MQAWVMDGSYTWCQIGIQGEFSGERGGIPGLAWSLPLSFSLYIFGRRFK